MALAMALVTAHGCSGGADPAEDLRGTGGADAESGVPLDPMGGPKEKVGEACAATDLDGPVTAAPLLDSHGPVDVVFAEGQLVSVGGEPCDSAGCPTCLYNQGYQFHYCATGYLCDLVQPNAQSGYYYVTMAWDGDAWRWRLYSFYYPYQDSELAPYTWDLGPSEHQPAGACDDGDRTAKCASCLDACAGVPYCSCKQECAAEDCG